MSAERPRHTPTLVFLATVMAVCYAPLLVWYAEGCLGAFRFFASDAFYYLAIAKRSQGAPFFSFDGRFPTNGFHPLWEHLLAWAFEAGDPTPEGRVLIAFGLSLVATAIGTGLFALAVLRLTRSRTLTLVASVPGAYYWLLGWTNPHLLSRWSFANGMESPLSILFFGLLCWLLLARDLLIGRASAARLTAVSALLALLVLTRLDDVFLLVPFALYAGARAGTRVEALRRTLAVLLLPGLALAAYLAHNLAYAGMALPVSGSAKAGGLVAGLLRNGYGVATTLFPFLDWRPFRAQVWSGEAWRVLQMLVPAAAGLLYALGHLPRGRTPPADPDTYRREVLALLGSYAFLKGAWNFCFVGLWQQGHWYYPLSLLTFDLVVAAALADAFRRSALAVRPALRRLALAASLLLVLLSANAFAHLKRAGTYHLESYRLFERRELVQRALDARCPGCSILAFDDGIISFSLAAPVMNGLGLALDREAGSARVRGELLELAYRRGFRLLSSLDYPLGIGPEADSSTVRRQLESYQNLRGQRLAGFEFRLLFVDPETGATFVGFEPQQAPHL
jgi:hypothetical protein